jgi:putative endonuclease
VRFHVYILSNKFRGSLYIGVTNNLLRRVYEHKQKVIEGFSKKYKLTMLVYVEEYNNVNEAIAREKQLKNWHREWKINLIESVNPNWDDLCMHIV